MPPEFQLGKYDHCPMNGAGPTAFAPVTPVPGSGSLSNVIMPKRMRSRIDVIAPSGYCGKPVIAPCVGWVHDLVLGGRRPYCRATMAPLA